jgi:transcriptional regulator with XRE-family HTH domain
MVNSDAIKRHRILTGKDGKQAAKDMGISHSLLFFLENGRNKNPKIKTVVGFCEHYNISIFEFLDKKTAKSTMLRFLYPLVSNDVISIEAASKIYKHHFKEKLSTIAIEELFKPSVG